MTKIALSLPVMADVNVSHFVTQKSMPVISQPVLPPPQERVIPPEERLTPEALLKRKAATGQFIRHLVHFSVAAASFGLAVAATVLSGGAGLPLVAVTGLAMVVSAGDTGCALYNLIQVRQGHNPLQTGNDSVVMAVKALISHCGCTESAAETAGDIVSGIIRVGIAVCSASLHLNAIDGLSKVSAGITALSTSAGAAIDMYNARMDRMQRRLTPPVNNEIKIMVDQLVACFEQSRASLPSAQTHQTPPLQVITR